MVLISIRVNVEFAYDTQYRQPFILSVYVELKLKFQATLDTSITAECVRIGV